MKQIFYKKVGRKYEPVYEYDDELLSALPNGNHLIMSYPGGKSTKINIDPNYAAMIAAGRVAVDTISSAIVKAGELRMQYKNRELTPEQHEAWKNLVDKFGPDARMLEWPSAREIAEAGVQAMEEEAKKLMEVPAVKKAYEHFVFMCELTKDRE